MSLLKLTIDRQSNTLVAFGGTPTTLPALFQYNNLPMQIQVVDPTGVPSAPYSAADLNGWSLRVGIWDTPTGTAGGPATLALGLTWTWDPVNLWFTGSLDLSSAALTSALGTQSSDSYYLEITITRALDRVTLLQTPVTVKAAGDEGTTVAPVPTDQYFNKGEVNAGYVPRVMENGGVIVIPDSNGVYAVEIGCNTDGTVKMNVITL